MKCVEREYREIIELYVFCAENQMEVKLRPLWEGHKLEFANGSDFVQHRTSYGSDRGCVEPAGVCNEKDYTAVTLEEAKELVLRNRQKLNEARYTEEDVPFMW